MVRTRHQGRPSNVRAGLSETIPRSPPSWEIRIQATFLAVCQQLIDAERGNE